VAGLFTLYFFFTHPPKPSVEPITAKPEVQEPPTPPTQIPPISQIPATTSSPEEQPFSLQLRAVERTWIRIQIDGQPGSEMTLNPGESTSHQGLKRIQLLVGNAGGLDIIFKGESLQKFGKSGEVVDLTFTPQGVEAKRHERQEPKPE
jgi:hypothetical protein